MVGRDEWLDACLDYDVDPPPTPAELAAWAEEDAIAEQQERDLEAGAYGWMDPRTGETIASETGEPIVP